MHQQLPEKFQELEKFIDWARPTETSRNEKRWSASLEESRAFYDAMIAHGPDALNYLNQFALDDISGPDLTLLNLCLALAECSATIEMYEDPRPKYVFPIQRFIPTHDTWTSYGQGGKS